MKLGYGTAADALAAAFNIDAAVLSALINAESAWNPNAVSPTGATGLGQWTKGTGASYGLYGPGFDLRRDSALNLTATAHYVADLLAANTTYRAAIGHYSGQGLPLSKYALYGAGRALIAAIDVADKGILGRIPVAPILAGPPQ